MLSLKCLSRRNDSGQVGLGRIMVHAGLLLFGRHFEQFGSRGDVLPLLGRVLLDPCLLGVLLSGEQRLQFLHLVVELNALYFICFLETALLDLKLIDLGLFPLESLFSILARLLVLLKLLVVRLDFEIAMVALCPRIVQLFLQVPSLGGRQRQLLS